MGFLKCAFLSRRALVFRGTIAAVLLLVCAGQRSAWSLNPFSPKNNSHLNNETPAPSPVAIAVHGGASNIKSLGLTPEQESAYRAGINAALDTGYAILQNGGTSLEAVTAAVRSLEDNPLFNAGKGSVLTHEGRVEMDASVMEGKNRRAGAVSGLTRVKNPILAAKAVMEDGKFVYLSGSGAEQFAKKQGLEMVDPAYFITPFRVEQLKKAVQKDTVTLDNESRGSIQPLDELEVEKFGTVGCVALDQYGNVAAATSTGGVVNKRYGRIGDSALIGAGTYADNRTCAVSCTGKGEDFIRLSVAHEIASRMRYKKESLQKAADHVILKQLKSAGGRGGCIAVDARGHIAMPFTTSGMFRGKIDTTGKRAIMIYAPPKKKEKE